MFLEIPAMLLIDEENSDERVEEKILINPMHVVSIEPKDRKNCNLVMVGDLFYPVPMSKSKLAELIKEFVKQNVLTKLYKDIKDEQTGLS
jgi:hypothetical protein